MQSLTNKQNTTFDAKPLINRYQPAQSVSPEKVRDAVRAWATSINNQDVVAGLIVEEWERQGGGALVFSNDLSRRRQKLFRWLDGTTLAAQRNIELLIPAIMAVLPLEFRGRLVPEEDKMARISVAMKECAEAKQAVLLGAPEHQKLKEVSEGIASLFRLMPDQVGPLMTIVTSMLGAV